jgi:hypothetical protein
MQVMEVVYEKVLLTNTRGYTSLNYSAGEQVMTELERLPNESYGILLKMRELYSGMGQHFVYESLESAAVF